MTATIPQPFAAVQGEHGAWTVQAHTPNASIEWVLIECSADCAAAASKAGLLNEIVAEALR